MRNKKVKDERIIQAQNKILGEALFCNGASAFHLYLG